MGALPLRLGKRQWCSLSPLLLHIILDVVVNAIRQEKDMKDIHIRSEKIKLPLFTVDMITYIKTPKNHQWQQ